MEFLFAESDCHDKQSCPFLSQQAHKNSARSGAAQWLRQPIAVQNSSLLSLAAEKRPMNAWLSVAGTETEMLAVGRLGRARHRSCQGARSLG